MPKQRITKETVVNAAFEIARSKGMEQVIVKNIADKIGCSVQPIYSYCNNMDSLRQDVAAEAGRFIQEYIAAHIDGNDLFRSTGNAYIQLAREEPHLFRIFILHQRRGISSLKDLYESEADPRTVEYIADHLHISRARARQLHLNMMIYTIGIGTVFSVTTPGIPTDEIRLQLEAAYEAFLNQALDCRDDPEYNRTEKGRHS